MPLTAANNTAQLTITSTDINGNTSINRGAGNPTLNGTIGTLVINNNVAVGTAPLSVPGTAFNVYVKNNATSGSGITVQVSGTLTGGVSQILALLQPGGMLLIWQVVNTVPGSGYTAISVTVAGGTAPIEY